VARNLNGNDRSWGVNVGRFGNRYMAERALVTTSLQEMETLQGSQRSIQARSTGFDANFIGMTRDAAELACKRLQARNVTCFMVGPS
jgi:D-alanyl-D-alanine carboxypeptidase